MRLRCKRKLLCLFSLISCAVIYGTVIFSGDLNHHESQVKAKLFPEGKFSQSLKVRGDIITKNAGLVSNEKIVYFQDTRPPLTSPRIRKYCNPPHSQEMGQEGLVSSDYELLNVHVVIRHGDRAPISRLPIPEPTNLSCLTDTTQFAHIPKVSNFVNVMAAQSQKMPKENVFYRWAMHPSHSICADGQLTGLGSIQHILNGIHYSERYYHKHRLFSETDWDRKVIIHTTEVSRTYQSAIALMYGLLPNFDIARLNLKSTKSVNFCEEKAFGPACNCLGIDRLRNKAGQECRNEEKYQNLMKRYENVLNYVEPVLSLKRKDIPFATTLMDGLNKHACHSLPLPCNAQGLCITSKFLEAVWEPIDYQSSCLHRNENYRKFAEAHMYGLIHRIAQEMNIAIHNKNTPVFHLYSGHDTTVSPMITALQLEDSDWPGYASRIVFELYHKKSTQTFVIRVLHNGNIVTSQVNFCKNKTLDGFCSFDELYHSATAKNLQDVCNFTL